MSAKKIATLEDQRKAAKFVTQLKNAKADGLSLDSAGGAESIAEICSKPGITLPAPLAAMIDQAPASERGPMIDMVLDSVAAYERRHGHAPSGDVLLNAFAAGHSLLPDVRARMGANDVTLDSASNAHHDQISLRPNAPIIGTTLAIACAVPFAYYAPVDEGGNEGRIVILEHGAETAMGEYSAGETLDGVNSGDLFLSSERTIALAPSAAMNGQFRAGQTDQETADPATPAVAVLRGRTMVFVGGLAVAKEVSATGAAATSQLVGSVDINGTTYTLGGTVTPATGAIQVTSAPALPAGTIVHAISYIDFEKNQESLAGRVTTTATPYAVFAAADRGIIRASIDSVSQFQAEIGYSPLVESSAAARTQYYNERHYRALRRLYRVAKNNGLTAPFNFDWANQGLQKTRAQIWLDFAAVLFALSQKMSEVTVGSSIGFGYVSRSVATQFKSLPSEIFKSSGLPEQPGMYRVGRLFDQVEVYYCPKLVAESANGATGEMLFVGKNPQGARAPIIIGDAVAPAFEALGTADDMKKGYGFYARGFTENNPHQASALAAAIISFTGLF